MLVPCPSCGSTNRIPAERAHAHPKCGRCATPIEVARPVEVSDDQLATLVARADVPILVDFWAPWCGPCRAVAPRLEALAGQLAGRLLVAKVNTDVHQRTAGQLGVQAIPTLAIYQGGQLRLQQPGALSGPQLQALVAPYL